MDEVKSTNIIEFISRSEWEKELAVHADRVSPIVLPKELNRRKVVSAFMDAFEMVGGVSRLAEFASSGDENYSTFLKLYARLLPSQANESLSDDPEKVIKHVLPRSKLDDAL